MNLGIATNCPPFKKNEGGIKAGLFNLQSIALLPCQSFNQICLCRVSFQEFDPFAELKIREIKSRRNGTAY